MKTFTIIWSESHAIDVSAETPEDAREMFCGGILDYRKGECFESEICDVYETMESAGTGK
jgi:hypothetical protein